MNTLPWRCAAIIGWVVVFTELDRRSDLFEIGAPGYALAVASVLLLVVPSLRRTSILRALALAFPIFFALELASGPIDLRKACASLIEFGGTGVTIALAASLARRLDLADEVLSEFAIGPSREPIEPFSRTQGEMFREVRRARRHERPLSLLAISAPRFQPPAALAQMLEQARRENADRYAAGKIAALLDEQTAGSNVIADRGDHFLLLLPEAGRQEAEQVAKRLERAASERHGIALRFGIASFPHEEITFEKLLETAESELREVEQTNGGVPAAPAESARLAPSTPAGS
jgi:GGDEF domain-containing protein